MHVACQILSDTSCCMYLGARSPASEDCTCCPLFQPRDSKLSRKHQQEYSERKHFFFICTGHDINFCWHVKAYFFRTSLDARPQNLHTFSKVNLKCIQLSMLVQWGKQDTVFTCPSAIIYKFYLPRAMGASTNVEP